MSKKKQVKKNCVLSGLLTQIFSHAWYRDDMHNALINPEEQMIISGVSKGGLAVLHLFGMGIFTRYEINNNDVWYQLS